MKILISIIAVIILTSCHSPNTVPHRAEIVALPMFLDKYMISGFAVGDGPDPGEFYLLSKRVAEDGNEEQFNRMLKDPCPAVRAMGLVCLAKCDYPFDVLDGDNAEITAYPIGCGGIHMTMEEFSKRLKEDEKLRVCYTETGEVAWEYFK